MPTAAIVAQVMLAAMELYRNHYGLAADWVPTAQDVADMIAKNNEWSAKKYEDEASIDLGLSKLPSPLL